jgi:hypothetical protein
MKNLPNPQLSGNVSVLRDGLEPGVADLPGFVTERVKVCSS